MAISTESSTFEYTRDWLVSSESLVRDAFAITTLSAETACDEARERIYDQEALDQPETEDNISAPDLPDALHPRPRAVIITDRETRKEVGTQTWASNGALFIDFEVLVPVQYLPTPDDSDKVLADKFTQRKQWGRRLWGTIRNELMATKARGDTTGRPYLNAKNIAGRPPNDPQIEEHPTWIGWTYEIEWNG